MSDKNSVDREHFSIEDIIAEVKAEQNGYIAADGAPTAQPETLQQTQDEAPEKKVVEFFGGDRRRPAEKEEGQETAKAFETIGFTRPDSPPVSGHEPEEEDEEHEAATEESPQSRRVILFKSRKKPGQALEGHGQEAFDDTGELPQYPVSDDDDYYIEEEEYEEEEEEEELYYDFLNIPFDDPTKAVKRLGKKVVGMSVRMMLTFLLLCLSGYLTFGAQLGLPQLPQIPGVEAAILSNGVLAACSFAAMILCWEVTASGIWRLMRLRPTLDSLSFFSCLCCTVHSVLLTIGLSRGASLSFVAVFGCLFALGAKRRRATNLRRVYKCMEISADPAAVKVAGGKKTPAAVKTHVRAVPEVSDAVGMDMTEKTSQVFAPVAIVASIALAAVASFGAGDGSRFPWALAVISSVAAPCALCMSSVHPWNSVSKKLFTSGAAILNYRSAVRLSGVKRAGADDSDIFPLGAVHIAGMKITTGAIAPEQAVADAAAVMNAVGGGVGKAFGDFAREQYLAPRKAINVRYFQGGGVAAQVRDDYVLMGSADFLKKMGVAVREGSDKKDAVFLSVNSYEAAIFTLKYSVQPQPYAAFGILGKMGITTDLAVRDFGITEDMVERRFAVKKNHVNLPPLEVKEAYWSDKLAQDEPPCAILTRDSFLAFAEVLGAAKCLVRSVRINLFCAYACSIIGMVTMYFLAAMDKIYLASPENILLYLLVWYLPVWFTGAFMTNY